LEHRRSGFETFNSFLRKRRKVIIVAWLVAVVVAGSQIPAFFGAVSYNVTGGNFGGPTNTESQIAQGIIAAQFPSSNASGGNGIILVLQGGETYSASEQAAVIDLNRTLARDAALSSSFTGMASVYSTEYSLLSSVVPSLVSQVAALNSSVGSMASGSHALFESDYLLEQGLIGFNQTSQLVYGVPAGFVEAWSAALPGCGSSPACADGVANRSVSAGLGQGGGATTAAYYLAFYAAWNASFASSPSPTSPSPAVRERSAVEQAVAGLSGAPGVTAQYAETAALVASGLNPADWSESGAVGNLTVSALQSEVPANLSSSLGVSLNGLVAGLISLGPSPDNSSLLSFTLGLFSRQVGAGALVAAAYELGPAPTAAQTWDLASEVVANASAASFSTSPLFTADARTLGALLSSFAGGTSTAQLRAGALAAVANETVSDYPLVLSHHLSRSFVSPDNSTMIVVYNFSVPPTPAMINAFVSAAAGSAVGSVATYYVTGSAVLTQDISTTFGPVVGITVAPGVVASLAIVGVLLVAPLAALVPILVGGIAIAIALPTIYYGVDVVGHGTLTFLTPALTILLTLGLAVDYSVLQLRRTKEERLNGRTTQDSVSVSVKWAGQAVLTAGITVVVAYVVMAVANVPLFSGVGTAIAIAISILILAALTLLPALELTLGDRLFWPGLGRSARRRATVQRSKLDRLARLGERTIRRKVAVSLIISAFALGAFLVIESTQSGADILKLFPDFPSNHGLTVIDDELGSSAIDPTVIVVTTPTPIVYGQDQFNQTLMRQVELISSTASSAPGVTSVAGPTRPYGSPFNYSGVLQLQEPERAQYLSGMGSFIGRNNETVQILVGVGPDAMSQSAIDALLKVESAVSAQHLMKGIVVHYGGDTQSTYDGQSFIDGILPEVILVLGASVYAILLVQLRSVFTPVRLVFTILCSVAFASALLILAYVYLQGLPILDFAPLFVVVTMLGVGIDYDIFFVTRIREEVLNGKTDDEAIKTALSKVWVTIFGLGLVLATVFGSLIATRIALLGEIGFVVAAAVLIDVGVVLLLFVPALMGLAERFNWWPSKIGARRSVPDAKDPESAPGGT